MIGVYGALILAFAGYALVSTLFYTFIPFVLKLKVSKTLSLVSDVLVLRGLPTNSESNVNLILGMKHYLKRPTFTASNCFAYTAEWSQTVHPLYSHVRYVGSFLSYLILPPAGATL
ncbi:hypothetical protein FEM48_Zijuj12G0059500 [Ziziphus jujuba var. spinosa]|uniref:Uncharacterized protein n=1 Tax=Ziziphus jujuba var. spinosa TaxID=714518 RepID=A0A978UBK3_ZIZJJ|nr:hypothetical protein FEM48_Zijuj12G0059500 [Ziziphus jujuba var. spinosa]